MAGVSVSYAAVSCTSLTGAGGPYIGDGVGNLVNYSDDISASVANLAHFSLYQTGGIVKYNLSSFSVSMHLVTVDLRWRRQPG